MAGTRPLRFPLTRRIMRGRRHEGAAHNSLALPQAATFSEGDLKYIMDSLAPNAGERPTLARAVREDREIREAVLTDDRIFRAVTDTEEAFIHVSSYLFFTVLLLRARRDLQDQGYTLEREGDFAMPVFDSHAVCEFLQPAEIRDYLVGVLAGFVKTEQRSVTLRGRDGKLRRHAGKRSRPRAA